MEYLTSPFDYWEGYSVKPLPIQLIVQVCPVDPLFAERVKKAIEKDGLMLPLVTADLSLRRLKQWYRHTKGSDMMPPRTYPKNMERAVAVFGGNTRLVVARELHYTHIDCVILNWRNEKIKTKMEGMYELQEAQRREHPELYPEKAKRERRMRAGFILFEAGEKKWMRVKPRGQSATND